MAKKERRIVFAIGLAMLMLFTFTDLQISMAVAKKPLWARVLEVVGEIPFTTLTIAACAILFRFRTKKNLALNILCAVGSGVLFALFSVMGGFMTYNYLSDNLGEISKLWIPAVALIMAGVAIWIAQVIPAENRSKALRYAAVVRTCNYHNELAQDRLGKNALPRNDRSDKRVHQLVSNRSEGRFQQHLCLFPVRTFHELRRRYPPDVASADDSRPQGQGKGAAYHRLCLVRCGRNKPCIYGRSFCERRYGGYSPVSCDF